MTLIDYHNQFWKEYRKKSFTPNETLLFHFLLDTWNNSGRKDSFELNTKEVEIMLGMNKVTLTRCRESLQKRGVIQYVKGNRKSSSPCYSFCYVTNDVTNNVTNGVTNDVTTHRVIRDIEKEDNSNELSKKAQEDSTKSERMDWGAFMQTFNDTLSPGIPKIISLSQSRRDRVKAIIKEFGKQAIMDAFQKIRESDFLMGRNRRPDDNWKCGFDFIFTKSKFIKILEGNYDNGTHQAHHSEKRSVNQQVFADFLAEREQRTSGMAYEVEKPF